MPPQRVAITGMGIISALGANLAETWSSLVQGKSGIAPIQLLDVSKLRFQNGAEVRGYDPQQHFEERQIDMMDRFAQFALIAARQALADSGLKIDPELSGKTAVVTG
ncbi:MAG TPA: beta-ketoacyl synthase N-terminal-like domain-containing protein, partial [Candidatus Angelobacter sp.]|nr:beta-ketoacyl synthase N-terminal-like domain-containing protein [Candidatus Angelobacter sp.]